MSTISETVTTTMRQRGMERYIDHAEPVITALERRESEIANGCLELAEQAGIESDLARQRLTELGLTLPNPEDLDGDGDDEDGELSDRVAALTRQIEELTSFARQNGFRGFNR